MTDTTPVPVSADKATPSAVAVRQPRRGDFLPMSMEEAIRFAETVQRADGMIPKAYLNNPGKILACVLAGQELGVGAMASLRAFHVVEGKPCADYTFWIARLKASGYRVEWLERTDERVTLKLTAPDGSMHQETWDKARAIRAGLWNGKDPWKKYPQTMLSARCVTSAGRAFAGEVMFGCYEMDEADEIIKEIRAERVDEIASGATAAQRVAAAAGSAISDQAAETERRAKGCADMARALGLSRDDVFGIMDELEIPRGRISELNGEQLEQLAERLDEEARMRGDGGPTDGGEAQP